MIALQIMSCLLFKKWNYTLIYKIHCIDAEELTRGKFNANAYIFNCINVYPLQPYISALLFTFL